MNRYVITKGNKTFHFVMNNIKYFISSNDLELYNIRQMVKGYFTNLSSDYQDTFGNIQITKDNKSLKKKDYIFYHINTHYSLTNDLKLTTKSLSLQYLECLLSTKELDETFNTLNILLESLPLEIDDSILQIIFQTLTPKVLSKMIAPAYLKEDEKTCEYDLSYDDIILIQLRMIDFISKHMFEKTIICLLEIPILTNEIKKCLKDMKSSSVIVLTSKITSSLTREDVMLVDYNYLDIADDQQLYEHIILKGMTTMEQGYNYVDALIQGYMDTKFDFNTFK